MTKRFVKNLLLSYFEVHPTCLEKLNIRTGIQENNYELIIPCKSNALESVTLTL